MKLTIEAKKLANTLQRVQACVAKRSTIEVYKRVLCEANEEGFVVTASDLESWMQVKTPAVVTESGKTVLPHKELKAIADKSEGDLNFAMFFDVSNVAKMLEVSGDGSNYNFALMNPDEFAPIENRDVEEWLHISAWELIHALRLTLFSVSHEEGKFAMRSILFEAVDSTLTLASTDSKRLSKFDCNLLQPRTGTKVFNVLIGGDCCNLLLQNLLRISYDTPVKIGIDHNSCYFKTEDSTLVLRISEGRFPSYRDVIPKKNLNSITLNRKAFYASIERLKMMLDDEIRRIRLDINGSKITMDTQNSKVGSGKVIHAIDPPATIPIALNLDPEFLLDVFRIDDVGDEVVLHYSKPDKSILITNDRYTHLIVPLT